MRHYGPKEHHGMTGRFRHCRACRSYRSVLIALAAAGICAAAQVAIARELPLAPFRYTEGFEENDLSTKAPGLAPLWQDAVQIDINGAIIPDANLRRVYHAEGRLEKFGRPLPAYTSLWFDLESPPAVNGDNTLGVTLVTTSDGPADVVIEEVEVVVMPKPVGAP